MSEHYGEINSSRMERGEFVVDLRLDGEIHSATAVYHLQRATNIIANIARVLPQKENALSHWRIIDCDDGNVHIDTPEDDELFGWPRPEEEMLALAKDLLLETAMVIQDLQERLDKKDNG